MPAALQGAIMAVMVAVLRVYFDERENRLGRILLEAVICGALSLMGSSLIHTIGLPPTLAVFIGGIIGFVGVEQVRSWLRSYVQSRVDRGE